MIIDKEVDIVVNSKNYKRYEDLGYNNLICGEKIRIKIEHFIKDSHQKILCACDFCGEEKMVKYQNYNKYIKKDTDGKYTCKVCNLEKRKKTCLEKYGNEFVSQNENIKKKTMIRVMELYGVENISQNQEIRKKIKNTNLERYGFKCILQNEDIKKRIKNTIIKKYGVENVSQNEMIHMKQHNGYITKHYNGFHYRGTYEKDFIDYCMKNQIEIENFKGSIGYNFGEKTKKYFPDFYHKDLNLIIEIKSSYTYKSDIEINEAKRESSISQGFSFIFIIDKNYDDFEKFLYQIV